MYTYNILYIYIYHIIYKMYLVQRVSCNFIFRPSDAFFGHRASARPGKKRGRNPPGRGSRVPWRPLLAAYAEMLGPWDTNGLPNGWVSLWLWLTGLAMEAMAPIEIDGLPNWKMVIFHGELLVIIRCYVGDVRPFFNNFWILLGHRRYMSRYDMSQNTTWFLQLYHLKHRWMCKCK